MHTATFSALITTLLLVSPLLAQSGHPGAPQTVSKSLTPVEANATHQEGRIAWNAARYTKTEAMVPMRDGKALYTVIYTPKDLSRTYPILLTRTPYGTSPKFFGQDKLPERLGFFGRDWLTTEGYIFVQQDVRGRFHSTAASPFEDVRPIRSDRDPKAIDEATDCWDTVEWLVHHAQGNNGRVGLMGLSYHGFYAAAGLIQPHPALRAALIQSPVIDFANGDDLRHHGALHLVHVFTGLRTIRPTTEKGEQSEPPPFTSSDAYRWFLQQGTLAQAARVADMAGSTSWLDLIRHPNYDSFWQARDLSKHLKETSVPTLVLSGWFDPENLSGSLRAFQALSGSGRGPVHLVVGPWTHGGWMLEEFKSGVADGERRLGPVVFGEGLVTGFRKEVFLPFLREHLKSGEPVSLPKARVFEGGTNQWRSLAAWPPAKAQPRALYLQEQGGLGWEAPRGRSGQDAFVSDPRHPVPHYPQALFEYGEDYPVADQWFASTRPDVLVYQTEPLTADLTLAGSVKADLWVATTGTDADWVVKVIDVWPDGHVEPFTREPGHMKAFQQLVRGDILRGKYRKSLERPEPFVPGKPTRVAFDMPDTFHTFKKGHRLMVQIQSSWFPLFDRNPQVFTNIYTAKPEQFRKAEHTVFHSSVYPSKVILPVLPASESNP